MTQPSQPPPVSFIRYFVLGPWGALLLALALALLAWGSEFVSAGGGPARVILAIASLIAAGAAVAWRLRAAGDSFEDQVESAGLVLLSSLLVEGIRHGLAQPWDSAQLLLGAMAALGVVASLILLLPPLGRKIVISAIVLFHFGGILTAVTAVPPPGGPAPWLSMQAWSRVYRPYLSFMYLNNAYHFYSPEPGPPTLLWFSMEYADNTRRWVKIPVRGESPVPLHYQRMLALTESTNQIDPMPLSEPDFNEKLHRRNYQGNLDNIPLHPLMPPSAQYRQPQPYSKMMISSYARFAARHFLHTEDPANIPVTGVRIYRVTHMIIQPSDLAAGYSPLEETLYVPFFQGDFDPHGNLKNENDPYLYWLLPIYPQDYAERLRRPGAPPPTHQKIVNCLEMHAAKRSAAPDDKKDEP
jgi:hypothetical protein